VPAIAIQHLEERCGRRVHELFDLVCGTSTGGILALGTCVARAPIGEMLHVYEYQAADIWKKSKGIGNLARGKAAYDVSGLEAILKEKSRDRDAAGDPPIPRQMRMNDAPDRSPRVCICAARKDPQDGAPFETFLFRTYKPTVERYQRCPGPSTREVWEAARATSAAPSYFDPLDIDGKRYVDGGTKHNNPVDVALKEAHSIWPERAIGCIVSLGCGLRLKADGNEESLKGMVKDATQQLTVTQPQVTHCQIPCSTHSKVEFYLRKNGVLANCLMSMVACLLQHLNVLDEWVIDYTQSDQAVENKRFGGQAVTPPNPCCRGSFYLRLNPELSKKVRACTQSTCT
jgi:hypothetical protein